MKPDGLVKSKNLRSFPSSWILLPMLLNWMSLEVILTEPDPTVSEPETTASPPKTATVFCPATFLPPTVPETKKTTSDPTLVIAGNDAAG